MRTKVKDGYKAIVFKDGRFEKILNAGDAIPSWRQVTVISAEKEAYSADMSLDVLMNYKDYRDAVDFIDVKDNEAAIRFVDGSFDCFLKSGKYAFFKTDRNAEVKIYNTEDPFIGDQIPDYIMKQLPEDSYCTVRVSEYEKARYYFKEKLVRVLDAGVYYFWNSDYIRVENVDTRLIRLDVATQEILSADKVSLRVNFTCSYAVTDVVAIASVKDFVSQIYNCAQMAIREYIGKFRLDEILDNREAISDYVMKRLKAKENEFFVRFEDAGVKDIVLPGEIRDIMNTVLLAEKKAQANVITRREEVASTRSLLNTAKLMEDNPTLYKLKELEYVERICENVGNISLNGNSSIVSQLLGVLTADK